MSSTIVSAVDNTALGVDPTFQAARVSHRPIEYAFNGAYLGHYSLALLSGAIAATPTALDPHYSFRWSPSLSNTLAVIQKIRVGWHCISAITTAVRMSYQANLVHGYTVDYATGGTVTNLAAVTGTNAMRSSMSNSQMGTAGPVITTTGALSGGTGTIDTYPFAITNWTVPGILTGTVSTAAGVAGPMQTLYEWTALGQHPVVLANNQGFLVRLTHTGWASGTVSLAVETTWTECYVF